jgi:hypothetical protein
MRGLKMDMGGYGLVNVGEGALNVSIGFMVCARSGDHVISPPID